MACDSGGRGATAIFERSTLPCWRTQKLLHPAHLGDRFGTDYMAFVANDPDELRDEADRYRTLAREFEGTVLADALRSSAEACDELARSIENEGQPHGLTG